MPEAAALERPLWRPSAERIAAANLTAFTAAVEKQHKVKLADYSALWRWSIDNPEAFWRAMWDFGGVIGEAGKVGLADAGKMPGARFFPEAKLNFAQNLLRKNDATPALIFRGEDKVKRSVSWAELNTAVSRLAQALRALGIVPGDRVAGVLAHMAGPLIAMGGAGSIGATWSSCSPDFGVQGVIDRFGQIEPKVLFAVDGYHYNGKTHDCIGKLREIVPRLPSLQKLVVIPYAGGKPSLHGLKDAVLWDDFEAPNKAGAIEFAKLP